MISYFLASSQCGVADSERVGMIPELNISSLSSSVNPFGTMAFGRFGILYKSACSESEDKFNSSESLTFVFFKSVVFCLKSFAFWTCPVLKNSPISLEIIFNSDEITSTLV